MALPSASRIDLADIVVFGQTGKDELLQRREEGLAWRQWAAERCKKLAGSVPTTGSAMVTGPYAMSGDEDVRRR